jgi:hypothetical protein
MTKSAVHTLSELRWLITCIEEMECKEGRVEELELRTCAPSCLYILCILCKFTAGPHVCTHQVRLGVRERRTAPSQPARHATPNAQTRSPVLQHRLLQCLFSSTSFSYISTHATHPISQMGHTGSGGEVCSPSREIRLDDIHPSGRRS